MTNKSTTTPKASTVPPDVANPQPNQDGSTTPETNSNGMTNGRGEPVAAITPENDAPMESQVSGGFPLNTTGLGANSVDGNNVGGRSVDQGVPAGVVDRLNDQKAKEEDDAGKS